MGFVTKKIDNKRKSGPEPEINENEKEKMDLAINFLKSVVVNDSNLDAIKEKLVETMRYRHDLMKNQRMDLKETFPFFFTRPQLVSEFIFEIYLFEFALFQLA